MFTKIKKIKEFLEKEYNKHFVLTLTTGLSDEFKAVIKENHIVINLNNITNMDLFLKSLAHEFAHLLLHSPAHDANFEKKKKEIYNKLKKRFGNENL